MARGNRCPIKRLHGIRKSRFIRAIGYPRILPGKSKQKYITVDLTDKNIKGQLHNDDKAVILHRDDINLANFGDGIELWRMHDKERGNFGEITHGFINEDGELDIACEVWGDTKRGYETICDIDHGVITGISIGLEIEYHPATKEVVSKRIKEFSLIDNNRMYYDTCKLKIIASRKTLTNRENYNNVNSTLNIKLDDRGTTFSSILCKMSERNEEGDMKNSTGDESDTSNNKDSSTQSNIDAAETVKRLTQELQNAQNAYNAEKATNAHLLEENSEWKKEADVRKTKKQKKEIEKFKPVWEVLAKTSEVDTSDRKIAEEVARAWLDPKNSTLKTMVEKLVETTSHQSLEIDAYRKKEATLGRNISNAMVKANCAKANEVLDDIVGDSRKSYRSGGGKGQLKYNDVYDTENMLTDDNFWNIPAINNKRKSRYISPVVEDAPFYATPSIPYGMPPTENTRVLRMTASRTNERQSSMSEQGQYHPHDSGLYQRSLNRMGEMGKSRFDEILLMSNEKARELVTLKKL